MPRRNDIAKILVIAAAFVFCSSAWGSCGSLDEEGRSKAGSAQKHYFLYQVDGTWKKVRQLPKEVEPDGGEVAWLSTGAGGWSLAWVYISSPDWIWTTAYCFSPSNVLSSARSRFSCAWGWVALQTATLNMHGAVSKSAITFLDNKTHKVIGKPENSDEYRPDFGEFQVYRTPDDLPFGKLLSKTGAGN